MPEGKVLQTWNSAHGLTEVTFVCATSALVTTVTSQEVLGVGDGGGVCDGAKIIN